MLSLYKRIRWSLVRSIAEIRLLTLTSYVILVFVPLLAGLWPIVRAQVYRYDHVLTHSISVLDSKVEELMTFETEITGSTSEVLSNLQALLRAHKSEISGPANLPWTWAAMFFASLAAVIGHFIYELFAPKQVRAYSKDEFIANKLDTYTRAPSDEAIRRAESRIQSPDSPAAAKFRSQFEKTLEGLRQQSSEDQKESLRALPGGSVVELFEYAKSLNSTVGHELIQPPLRGNLESAAARHTADHVRTSLNHSKIERAAHIEYEAMSAQNQPAVVVALAFYGFALATLLMIISVQVARVVSEAGWSSITDFLAYPLQVLHVI